MNKKQALVASIGWIGLVASVAAFIAFSYAAIQNTVAYEFNSLTAAWCFDGGAGSGARACLARIDTYQNMAQSFCSLTLLAFVIMMCFFAWLKVSLPQKQTAKTVVIPHVSSKKREKAVAVPQTISRKQMEIFQHAKECVQQRRYDDARKVLTPIDHPKAREWEAKLDEIEQRKNLA